MRTAASIWSAKRSSGSEPASISPLSPSKTSIARPERRAVENRVGSIASTIRIVVASWILSTTSSSWEEVHKACPASEALCAYIELDLDLQESGDGDHHKPPLRAPSRRSQWRRSTTFPARSGGKWQEYVAPMGSADAAEDRPVAINPARDASRRRWRQLVPFLLRLRDLQTAALPSPRDWPAEIGSNPQAPESSVEERLEHGNALVMIDGFDEVPPSQRDDLLASIERCTKRYPTHSSSSRAAPRC